MTGADFIVSVADVYAYDPNTDELLFITKTNTTTSIAIEMGNTEVNGGFGNATLLQFYHSRKLNVDLMASTWEKQWLATSVGTTIATKSDKALKTECITLVGGAGTVSETPIGDIAVTKPDGSIIMVTPTGSDFVVAGLTTEKVTVTYFRSKLQEQVVIDSKATPSVLKLVLKVPQFDQAGINGSIEIEIPRYQTNGSFNIELSADGVQSSNLSGTALAFDIDGGDNTCDTSAYAVVRIIPETATSITYAGIVGQVGDTNDVELAIDSSAQIDVLGIRGRVFANVPITENLTFAMDATSDADITVDANGLITVAGTATATDVGIVDITYTGQTPNLTAKVFVEVI